jgi:predicted ATP-dependent Lon-type protease
MAQSISSNRKTAPQIAVEMRKRVTDQLGKILPTEFSDVDYAYTVKRQ